MSYFRIGQSICYHTSTCVYSPRFKDFVTSLRNKVKVGDGLGNLIPSESWVTYPIRQLLIVAFPRYIKHISWKATFCERLSSEEDPTDGNAILNFKRVIIILL